MNRRDDSERTTADGESRYGEELLRANWNPVLDLLERSVQRTRLIAREAPAARSDEEAAAFLRRIYNSGA